MEFANDIIALGQPHEPELLFVSELLEEIIAKKEYNAKFEIICEFETQYDMKFHSLMISNKDFVSYSGQSPIFYFRKSNKLIGNFSDFLKFLTIEFSYTKPYDYQVYSKMAVTNYNNYLKGHSSKFAYLTLNNFSDKLKSTTIIIELFFDVTPKAVMNFLEICKGKLKNKKGEKLTYEGCEIFRVVNNGYIQSGDLSHLAGGKCIYEESFEDDNYTIKHDSPGILGMVKRRGVNHTNESQFYITLNSIQSFDSKFVAFGRVIKGFEVVRHISEVQTYMQRPVNRIEIVSCGEYLG